MWDEIIVAVPPVNEPVEVYDLKLQARLDLADNTQDELLLKKIKAARESCEGFCRRSLITQTLDIWYSEWDGPGLIEKLPRGKVQEIVGLYFYDDDNVESEIDASYYSLVGSTLTLSWFPGYQRRYRGTKVRIISGYGDDPEDVPEALKEGILELATVFWEKRLGEGTDPKFVTQTQTGGLPSGVFDKWNKYQVRYV